MAAHVYARLCGFGWILIPRAPFRLERVPDRARTVIARHDDATGLREAVICLDGDHPLVTLANGTAAQEEVLDLIEGPMLDDWRIETTVFTACWPVPFALASSPVPGSPFDLLGPGSALIHVQGPIACERLPSLPAMAAPGQTVRRHQRMGQHALVELEYLHEGAPWRQSHRIVGDGLGYALIVSAQTPEAWADQTDAAAQQVATSLQPYDGM